MRIFLTHAYIGMDGVILKVVAFIEVFSNWIISPDDIH